MNKLLKALILTIILICLAYPVYAVNTITTTDKNQVIVITGLDVNFNASTATETSSLLRGGVLEIVRIEFIPSATDDRMIIRDGGIDATEFFDSGKCADAYDVRTLKVDSEGEVLLVNPVIDISDCTLGTAANAKVMIYIRRPRPY